MRLVLRPVLPMAVALLVSLVMACTALAANDSATAKSIDLFLARVNSPMVGTGDTIVRAAKTYGVDPGLIVGIAGQESGYGKILCRKNPFGYRGATTGSYCLFDSWEEAIWAEAKLLGQPVYKGKSPWAIAQIYCACPDWRRWASNVSWIADAAT